MKYQLSRGSGRYTAFIATDVGGAWQPAFEPWLPANTAEPPSAELNGVSCSGQQNCTAVGWYFDNAGNQQLMVITETNGTWGQTREIGQEQQTPGRAALGSVVLSHRLLRDGRRVQLQIVP